MQEKNMILRLLRHEAAGGVLLIVEEPTGDTEPWLEWLRAEHYPALLATHGTAGAMSAFSVGTTSCNRGDTPLSRELVQGGALMVAAVALWLCGQWLIDAFAASLRAGLDVDPDQLDQIRLGDGKQFPPPPGPSGQG